jgi:phage protein U
VTDVLMTLGKLRFSVQEGAYQRIRRDLEITTAKQARGGSQVARQILGEDERLEIEGIVYAGFKAAVTRLDDFRTAAREYSAKVLTDGLGNVWGKYVIERVEEVATEHTAYGVPLKQTFRLELGLYGG